MKWFLACAAACACMLFSIADADAGGFGVQRLDAGCGVQQRQVIIQRQVQPVIVRQRGFVRQRNRVLFLDGGRRGFRDRSQNGLFNFRLF